jgi:hypothetical protein
MFARYFVELPLPSERVGQAIDLSQAGGAETIRS